MNIEKAANNLAEKTPIIDSSGEKTRHEEILKHSNESQVAYLHRAEKVVTQKLKEINGMLFDPTRSLEEDLPPEIISFS